MMFNAIRMVDVIILNDLPSSYCYRSCSGWLSFKSLILDIIAHNELAEARDL